ncbi:MAG: SHOCT domain-containing protein [Epsilonproteobacteria bacterium]|nr:MAG: SHOCT domain-containing protein [Campylobacterota bacterium]
MGHGWGMGFGMWFTLILFILIIFYFFKESTKSRDKHSSAQDILDRRYANGEIDTEEYEEKSNALKKYD